MSRDVVLPNFTVDSVARFRARVARPLIYRLSFQQWSAFKGRLNHQDVVFEPSVAFFEIMLWLIPLYCPPQKRFERSEPKTGRLIFQRVLFHNNRLVEIHQPSGSPGFSYLPVPNPTVLLCEPQLVENCLTLTPHLPNPNLAKIYHKMMVHFPIQFQLARQRRAILSEIPHRIPILRSHCGNVLYDVCYHNLQTDHVAARPTPPTPMITVTAGPHDQYRYTIYNYHMGV